MIGGNWTNKHQCERSSRKRARQSQGAIWRGLKKVAEASEQMEKSRSKAAWKIRGKR
jgi:hypothetical protein